jgi:hypothetical protein
MRASNDQIDKASNSMLRDPGGYDKQNREDFGKSRARIAITHGPGSAVRAHPFVRRARTAIAMRVL